MSKVSKNLIVDIGGILVSVCVAIFLVKTQMLEHFLTLTGGHTLVSSFVAGLFFTSVFTTIPSLVILGELAQHGSVALVALCGACGAVIGDLIIFRFVRDRFSSDIAEFLHYRQEKRTHAGHYTKVLRFSGIILGGIILASPLPDELGIGLMGFSKLRTDVFMLISFTFNFSGIFVIGTLANAI